MRKFRVIDASYPISETVIDADEVIVKSSPQTTVSEFITYNNGETLCEGATVVAVVPHTWGIFEIK